jgi:PKD repeat protein
MKNLLTLLLLLVVFSCKHEPDPFACFTWLPDTLIHVGDSVRFINCSENSDLFAWAFGDEGTSTDTKPTHIFTSIGEFEVTLIAYGNQNVDTLTKRIGVTERPDQIYFSNLSESIVRSTVRSFRWVTDIRNPGFWPTPPDSSTSIELDVDNDNQNDFIINLSHHPQEPPFLGSGDGYRFFIQIVGLSNADSIAHTKLPNVAGYYAEAEPIPFNSTWSSKGVLSLRGFAMEFQIEGDYIGFKHQNSVGWIKIKALDLNGIAVENFAINLTAEKRILAGQK